MFTPEQFLQIARDQFNKGLTADKSGTIWSQQLSFLVALTALELRKAEME